jgi:hypothetical protein
MYPQAKPTNEQKEQLLQVDRHPKHVCNLPISSPSSSKKFLCFALIAGVSRSPLSPSQLRNPGRIGTYQQAPVDCMRPRSRIKYDSYATLRVGCICNARKPRRQHPAGASLFLCPEPSSHPCVEETRGKRRRNFMTSAIIDLLAIEAVFLSAFTGIISASMWHQTHIDSEMAAGELPLQG